MKKSFLYTILGTVLIVVFILSTISAVPTYTQNKVVDLRRVCGNCTTNNITSIVLPNSSVIVLDSPMTPRGTEFNYSFSTTDLIGNYIVNGVENLDGAETSWSYEFIITNSGGSLEDYNVFSLGILLSLFLITGLFFWLYSTNQGEFKMFWLALAFIFLFSSVATSLILSKSTTLYTELSAVLIPATVISGILVIIIFYMIFIEATKLVLEHLRKRRGIE